MKFTIKTILNAVRLQKLPGFLRFACSAVLFVLCASALWAGGWKDQIETVTAEGSEIWEHEFDVTDRKKGLYNFIVYARDRAGNEAVSGAFNLHIDPNAGLPIARVVYPENNAIVRQNINLLGVASGHYGVEQVMVRLNDNAYIEVNGTEYWNQLIDFTDIPDGRHTFYVHAIDSKGAVGPELSINFILDTAPPNVELVSHNIGDIITRTVTLKGVASDANGIRTLEYSEDGVKFNSLSGKKRGARGGSPTEIDFSITLNTRRMPDGPLVYYLRAVDATGVATVKPYLFFVTNSGPDLEVYTPVQAAGNLPGEDIFDTFYLSGYAYDTIGLSSLYYEWGKDKEEIPMRPGDPFWHIALGFDGNSPRSIKVSAVDKVGNVTSVTRKLEDRRKQKAPILIIDYPTEEGLKSLQKGMPVDTAIYGRIAPGVNPYSVLVEGLGEVEALSAFRIDPYMIPHGQKAQTLKLTPLDIDSVKGAATTLRYLKSGPLTKIETEITVSSPEKNSWQSGASFMLEGNVGNDPETRLEYRLNPQDNWQSIYLDMEGGFSTEVDMANRLQGPVHLELRTVRGGVDNYPMYNPFSWARSVPEIQIIAPVGERALVYGNKTVMGSIEHTVPIYEVAYSLDRENFIGIPFFARYGKTWFSYFCDFNTLGKEDGVLSFRITDSSGAVFYENPEYTIEPNPPIPIIIVNTPVDEMVVTDTFDISGLAYDEVGIYGVYWRLLGPKMESISPGLAGEEARRHAAFFEAAPDRPFEELLTDQNFAIPVEFSTVIDGEYILEIYASDIYGVQSETTSRIIKVSTAPPETEILSPPITRYNQKAITVRGFSSDANGIEAVALSMDSGNTFQNVTLRTDGSWELPLNTAAYVDNVYSALIRTRDKYGITTFSNAMINIDNTPPELYLSSPVDGQHIGTTLSLIGRVSDNLAMKELTFQIISAENPNLQQMYDLDTRQVIFDYINLNEFPKGEYMIRVAARDLADNETIVSRKIVYDPDDEAAQIAIYNPLPGELHSGPIHVVGIIGGAFQPRTVTLIMNDIPLGDIPVDRYGIFRHEIDELLLEEDGAYRIYAYYDTETGIRIQSPNHTVYYSSYGPILEIESHRDGDVITGRPWLSGRAWASFAVPGEDEPQLTRRERSQLQAENRVKRVMVSNDNGRTFKDARGTSDWKFRLETSELPRGPQPVLVKAEFANGAEAVRRLMVYVDTTIPQVTTISPPEDSRHRDEIRVFGTAGDNYELADVDISLRPYDKFFYSVPGAIQGLYFDVKGLGATYFDVGLGLSFFDDNVRLQAQFGITPDDGVNTALSVGGRYVGYVYGVKLLANIFYLPFDYLFGLDWAFYSMNLALGANFSLFTMDEWRSPLYMGAVVAQWDIANINMQYFYPGWKYFRNFALYLQPELWFASSDVNAETIFRMTFGMRINWF